MEAEVDEVVGPTGKHNRERAASRHGHEAGSMTLGGRRVPVSRPRARSVDDKELAIATARSWVVLRQDGAERYLVDSSFDAGERRRGSGPFTVRLGSGQEVVLGAGRHAPDAIDAPLSLLEVVALIRSGELDEREHPL